MKKSIALLIFVIYFSTAPAQLTHPFRFAFVSDTHIGSPSGTAAEDLRATIKAINDRKKEIAFVVLTGDITELGQNSELRLARQILDSLDIPWYIIPGNHDTGWSESGGESFTQFFGSDHFSFNYNGIRFIGCASGPYVRMSDGHVPRQALNWMDKQIAGLPEGQPVLFLNHYPINTELDNWYEITNRLHAVNTIAILCGHGHTNKVFDFEGIPGIMGRSNLRAAKPRGGFNIVEMKADSAFFTECNEGVLRPQPWASVALNKPGTRYGEYPRPDYSLNAKQKMVKLVWDYQASAGIISSPLVTESSLVIGDQSGELVCLDRLTKAQRWKIKLTGSFFSSPAASNGNAVLGSTDGYIYAVSLDSGRVQWKYKTGGAVLGSPLVQGDTIFIGASDHSFYALQAKEGKALWTFSGLDGPVVCKPLLYDGKIIFGAWDTRLYALESSSGKPVWTWSNGSPIRNYSPAACTPVAYNGIVYVVAPDRYISAIRASDGQLLWRNNDTRVRESIGISGNGEWIYGKTMQDTVVAYHASAEKENAGWIYNAHFGYEHVPSMISEKNGTIYFGTRNGVVYAVRQKKSKTRWMYKIDNSMVNTVVVKENGYIYATTMDGRIVCLQEK